MRIVTPVRFVFKGDIERAKSHMNIARVMLGQMDARNPGPWANWYRTLPDGTQMRLINNGGQRMAIIDSPETVTVTVTPERTYYLAFVTGRKPDGANVIVLEPDNWTDDIAGITGLPNIQNGGACHFSPDGNYLLAGGFELPSFDRTAYVYSTSDWSLLTTITASSPIAGGGFSYDSTKLAVARAGVYSVPDWALINNPFSGTVTWVTWSPDGGYLAYGKFGSPGAVVYETTGWTSVFSGYSSIDGGVFTADGNYLLIAYGSSFPAKFDVLNVGTWSVVQTVTLPATAAGINYLATSLDGSRVAVAHGGWDETDTTLTIYDTSDWSIIPSPAVPDTGFLPPTSCAFSPDGRYVALAYSDSGKNILIVDLEGNEVITGPAMGATSSGSGMKIDFSPFITS